MLKTSGIICDRMLRSLFNVDESIRLSSESRFSIPLVPVPLDTYEYECTGWAEKNVPNFKAVLLLNCITENVQMWMV